MKEILLLIKETELYLKGFIEEILYTPGHPDGESVRVTDHVQAEQYHVHLFDGLTRVVPIT